MTMKLFVGFFSVGLCLITNLGVLTAKCLDGDAKFFSQCPEPKIYATVGERVTLSCARHGEMEQCYWYHRKGKYSTSTPISNRLTQLVDEKCELHLNTDERSAGIYQCIPHVIGDTNPAPFVETELTVMRRPHLDGLKQYQHNDGVILVREDSRNELECKTRHGTPSPTFSWFIDSEDVTVYAEDDGDISTLKMHKMETLRQYHNKKLFCQIAHPTLDKPARFSVTLNIIYEPELLGATQKYTASSLGSSMNIPFDVTTNPELSLEDYILIIENPHGLVEHRLKAGENTFSGTYAVTLPEHIDGSVWRFYVMVNNVNEEVLNNIHHIQLMNAEGMQSALFSFVIDLQTDWTKLTIILAASGFGLLLLLCVVGAVINKKRIQKKKEDEAWKLWTSKEKLRSSRWDTLPYIGDDHTDEKKHNVNEHEEEDDKDRNSDTSSQDEPEKTHTTTSTISATGATPYTLSVEYPKLPEVPKNNNNNSFVRSALACII